MPQTRHPLVTVLMLLAASVPGRQAAAAEGPFPATVVLASNVSSDTTTLWNPVASYFRNGADLAIAEAAAALKAANVVLTIDTQVIKEGPVESMELVGKLVKSNAVAVVGFPYSSDVLAVGPQFKEAGLMLITPGATADRIAELGSFVRSIAAPNSAQARLIAQVARQHRINAVVVISAADRAYSQSLREEFKTAFVKQGGTIAADIVTLTDHKDPGAVAKDLNGKQFDAIYIPNYEIEAAAMISSLIDQGIKPRLWLGCDAWGALTGGFREIMGARKIQGFAIAPWHALLRADEAQAFVARYQKAYKVPPHDVAVTSYEAMKQAIQGILYAARTRGLVDRKTVAEGIDHVRTYKGPGGTVTYAPGKNMPERPAALLTIVDTKVAEATKASVSN